MSRRTPHQSLPLTLLVLDSYLRHPGFAWKALLPHHNYNCRSRCTNSPKLASIVACLVHRTSPRLPGTDPPRLSIRMGAEPSRTFLVVGGPLRMCPPLILTSVLAGKKLAVIENEFGEVSIRRMVVWL